jgi:hypothetical protein
LVLVKEDYLMYLVCMALLFLGFISGISIWLYWSR